MYGSVCPEKKGATDVCKAARDEGSKSSWNLQVASLPKQTDSQVDLDHSAIRSTLYDTSGQNKQRFLNHAEITH